MFNGGYPYYQGYPSNPYLYHGEQQAAEAHARALALAEQRARRAHWLPEEDDDYVDERDYGQRERAYADAYRDQMIRERGFQRRQQEEAAARRWQHGWDRGQYEDDAVRQRERERQQQQQHQQQQEFLDNPTLRQQANPRGPPIPVPLNVHPTSPPNGYTPTFPQPQLYQTSPQPQPYQKPATPQPQPQPTSAPTSEHVDAAAAFQDRSHTPQQLQTIKSLSEQFDSLRSDFTLPPTISFQNPSTSPPSGDTIDVPAITVSELNKLTSDQDDNEPMGGNVPKLAFNSTNYRLLAYIDSLDKLLVRLDGVESMGDPEVRTRRREVVKQIEKEQARVDRFGRESWARCAADGRPKLISR